MSHIKKVNEMLDDRYFERVNTIKLPIRFTKDDKENLKKVAMVLNAITSKWSNFLEDNEEMWDSDTHAEMMRLSNLAQKYNGEWEDEIIF